MLVIVLKIVVLLTYLGFASTLALLFLPSAGVDFITAGFFGVSLG